MDEHARKFIEDYESKYKELAGQGLPETPARSQAIKDTVKSHRSPA